MNDIAEANRVQHLALLVLYVDAVGKHEPALFPDHFGNQAARFSYGPVPSGIQVGKVFALIIGKVNVVVEVEVIPCGDSEALVAALGCGP